MIAALFVEGLVSPFAHDVFHEQFVGEHSQGGLSGPDLGSVGLLLLSLSLDFGLVERHALLDGVLATGINALDVQPQAFTLLLGVHLTLEGGRGDGVVQRVEDLVVDSARFAKGVLMDQKIKKLIYCPYKLIYFTSNCMKSSHWDNPAECLEGTLASNAILDRNSAQVYLYFVVNRTWPAEITAAELVSCSRCSQQLIPCTMQSE